MVVRGNVKEDWTLTKWSVGFDSQLVLGPPRVPVRLLSPCAPNRSTKAGCGMPCLWDISHKRFFKKSRLVIPGAGFPLIIHEYGHRRAETINLKAVWKEVERGGQV